MKLDRIYTRGGDSGLTSLGDGTRVPKYQIRVRAMGSVDEANSALGVAILHIEDLQIREMLSAVQNDLFDLGADLCRPELENPEKTPLRIAAGQVAALERQIDLINASLGPLTSFVLPGGTVASAQLHVARAISRRAERDIAELAAAEPINPEMLKYLNRLSDLLFVSARYTNKRGTADVLWLPGLNR